MQTWEFVLLLAALGLAVYGLLRSFALKAELKRAAFAAESTEASLRRLREELEQSLRITRGHLARLAAGGKPDPQMIVEGLPFADITAPQAQSMLEQDPAIVLLDVRTPGEYTRGHIPGSRLLPVDELERRVRELPQDKTAPLIVHCQSGGRSAAACEYLAGEGYSALYNMVGGIGAWRGPVEQGSPLGAAR